MEIEKITFLKENVRKCVSLSFGDLGFRMGAGKCEVHAELCLVSRSVAGTSGNKNPLGTARHTPYSQHSVTPQAYFPA